MRREVLREVVDGQLLENDGPDNALPSAHQALPSDVRQSLRNGPNRVLVADREAVAHRAFRAPK